MKEIKDKQAVAKLLNQDIHIKGGGVMNLKTLAPKVEKIVDKDLSDDVEEFPLKWVKLPDIEYTLQEDTKEPFDKLVGHIDISKLEPHENPFPSLQGTYWLLINNHNVELESTGNTVVLAKTPYQGPNSIQIQLCMKDYKTYKPGDVFISLTNITGAIFPSGFSVSIKDAAIF